MKRITVFCGSNPGNDPLLMATAYQLGEQLAKRTIDVVYGGGLKLA